MKDYKTDEELIEYFKLERNLDLSGSEKYFEEFRFSSIYTPYKDLFAINALRSGQRTYPANLGISNFVEIVNLDLYFSILLNLSVGNFERRLKSFLSNIICKTMRDSGDTTCTDYSFLDDMLDNDLDDGLPCFIPIQFDYNECGKKIAIPIDGKFYNLRKDFLNDWKDEITNCKNKKVNIYLKDYAEAHENKIPFWLLIGSFSFGDLSLLFNLLKIDYKKSFYRSLYNVETVHDDEIHTFSKNLSTLTTIRNIVHHHEPVIPFLIKKEQRKFEDSKLYSFKLVVNTYRKSKFYVFKESKPIYTIEKNGRNTKYLENLEKFYKIM